MDINEQSLLLRPAKPEFEEGIQFADELTRKAGSH
jgi:hypothetical protein